MLLAALAPFPVAAAGETVALVVGNARYASERLPGAADAAERLAARLEALGVEVTLVRDATRAPFERAGREFAERADGASLAIVAYAGHALRLGGSAYLVPTDVDLRSRSDLKRLPDLQRLVDTASRAERSVVVLDTCHASNFAAGWGERRYDKAPLCPGDDTGFERPAGTLLAWASDVPTPRGEGDGTGRLLERLAERLEAPSTDLIGALRAATEASSGASVVGGEGASWPLLEPIEPVAADAPDTGRDAAAAAAPPDGLYRIANLYRSRRLGAGAGGEVALVGNGDASATDVWSLRANDDGSVALSGAAGEGALVPDGAGVALAAGREGRWRVLPVDGGLPDEFALRDADGGGWLVGDIASGRVALGDAPGGTGWLLERFDGDPPTSARTAASPSCGRPCRRRCRPPAGPPVAGPRARRRADGRSGRGRAARRHRPPRAPDRAPRPRGRARAHHQHRAPLRAGHRALAERDLRRRGPPPRLRAGGAARDARRRGPRAADRPERHGALAGPRADPGAGPRDGGARRPADQRRRPGRRHRPARGGAGGRRGARPRPARPVSCRPASGSTGSSR